MPHMLLVFFTLAHFLSIQPFLTKKKMQLDSNLVSKEINCAKNVLRTKLIFFLNCTIVIHNKM